MMSCSQHHLCTLKKLAVGLVFLIACPSYLQASEPEQVDDEYDDYYCSDVFPGTIDELEPQPVDEPIFSFLDPHQEYISDYLRGFTTSVDQFMSDTEKRDKATGSFVRITFDTTWNEAGNFEFDPGIKFRLRLPQTQRKLKLVIESDPDEKRSVKDLETDGGIPTTEAEKDRGVYTGLETEVGKSEKWKIKPSLGIKIRSPLDYYLRLRASRKKDFDNWKFYFTQTFYWFDSTGFGADSAMDWDRPLAKDLLFRSSSFVRYTDERDQFDMSQSLNIIQQLSPNRTLTYKLAVFADTEPAIYATTYLINLRYRQNVHKDYVFIELQPQIQYEKETDFEAEHSLFLRLELIYRG